MVGKYEVRYRIEILDRQTDKARLAEALAVYSRSTSAGIRTRTNEILSKICHPETAKGQLLFLSLHKGRSIVGFALLAYFQKNQTIVIDHLAIDEEHRKHGSFYVFSSLIQQLILEKYPEYDYVVAEIPIDKQFSYDGVNGNALVRLLRSVGFKRAQVKYRLPNIDARIYKKTYDAALMIRGAHHLSEPRSEDLIELVRVIMFDFYSDWYKDFLAADFVSYERHLNELFKQFKTSLNGRASVLLNGSHSFSHPLSGSPVGWLRRVLLSVCRAKRT